LLDAEKYIPAIINLLNDPLDYVRWDISGLLHDFGDQRVIKPLINVILNDPDSDVRHNACYALSAIGDSNAISALRHVVENDKGTDYEGRSVSDMAAEALRNILERINK
jgi:HEAT repeat protein